MKIPIKDILKEELEHPYIEEMPRDYLGMSMIGDPCDRSIQYYHRWADTQKMERRIRRLLDFGKIAEAQMRAELERIGCKFTGSQLELMGFAKHWKGHIDGVISEVPDNLGSWLLEYKTHNHKFFKILRTKGVQKGFPAHYDQTQRYLGGLPELNGCMYIGYNKDDSDFHIEFIPHDLSRQKELKSKEMFIVLEDKLLPRVGTGQITWFQCKLCNFKRVCYNKQPILKTCRSCKYVECADDGLWRCEKHSMGLGVEKQKEGCEDYELDKQFFNQA